MSPESRTRPFADRTPSRWFADDCLMVRRSSALRPPAGLTSTRRWPESSGHLWGSFDMPKMQTTVAGLNTAFSPPNLPALAAEKDKFAHGRPLHEALAAHGAEPGSVLHR